jgi:hypothetical protein
MFISQNNCKTQGLRKAYINAITSDRYKLNKGVKELKKLDASRRLARRFTDIKYYGGSFKSFLSKVKGFGKRIWESAKNVTKNMYKPVKGVIKILQKEPVKSLVEKGANAVGTAFGVPGLGKIVSTAVKGADSISDILESIVKAITEKNPNVTVQEAKKLVNEVRNVVDDVGSQLGKDNVSEEVIKKIKEQGQQVLQKLPTLIKHEGYDKVEQAAGYLPFLDAKTYKEKERTGKGGRVLEPMKRFLKPKIVTKYQHIFDKYGIPKYSPDIVGKVGGRMFMGGKKIKNNECGRMGNGISDKAGRMGGMPNPKSIEEHMTKELGRKPTDEEFSERWNKISKSTQKAMYGKKKGGAEESKESLLDILKSRLNK